MNDKDLKKLWGEQYVPSLPPAGRAADIGILRQKMKKFDRTIWRRDFGEVVACAVIVVAFGGFFFWVASPMARAGCAINVLAGFFIAWRLLWSKRRAGKDDPNASVLDSLRRETQKLEIQIKLLRTIFWWYLLPLAIGGTLFFFGVNTKTVDRTIWIVVQIAIDWPIYRANRRAVQKYLEPLKVELESLLTAGNV